MIHNFLGFIPLDDEDKKDRIIVAMMGIAFLATMALLIKILFGLLLLW